MKKTIYFGFLLIIIVSLCACGKKTVKNKDEIQNDIRTNDEIFSEASLDFDSFNITNRLTDSKKGTDHIVVNFVAKCDHFTYFVDADLDYILYDNGWNCENYYINTQTITPLIDCTENIAEQGLNDSGWTKESLLSTKKISDTQVEYVFSATKPYSTYFNQSADVIVTCGFSVYDLWDASYVETVNGSTKITVGDAILGRWELTSQYLDDLNTYGTVIIEILSCEGDMITFSYDINVHVVGWRAFYDTKELRAQGKQTGQLVFKESILGRRFFDIEFEDDNIEYHIELEDKGISSISMRDSGAQFDKISIGKYSDDQVIKVS